MGGGEGGGGVGLGESVLFLGMGMEFEDKIVLEGCRKANCQYGPATGILC